MLSAVDYSWWQTGWSHFITGWLSTVIKSWLTAAYYYRLGSEKIAGVCSCSSSWWAGVGFWALQIMGQFLDPLLNGREGVLLTVVRSSTWSCRCVFFKLTLFLRRTSSLLLEYTSHIGPTSFLRGWLKIWIIQPAREARRPEGPSRWER